jgi:hypothetical protein
MCVETRWGALPGTVVKTASPKARHREPGNMASCPTMAGLIQNRQGHPQGMPLERANTMTRQWDEAAVQRPHAALCLLWTFCYGVAQSAVLGVVLKRAENAPLACPAQHLRDRSHPPSGAARRRDMQLLARVGQPESATWARCEPGPDLVGSSAYTRSCISVGGAL